MEPRPGAGQVAIDVAWAGLNFVDVMTRRGDGGYTSEWPYLPGKEVAGTVRELGEGVTGRLARAIRTTLDLQAGGGLSIPLTELPGLEAVPAAHDAMQEGRATGKYVVRVAG
ncbi:alcohol dehydrogenase catalytic domain-containing protein [Kitasatospora sp. SUK 42]|uniref:alcohol dehydrogenase catalytic domain-containing protein n=1 Tax=Kitasatospora sp. SUK 42 TaxID=1588882 RepID=UPI0027E31E1E|nr:alcohol dehydrogenase catalytic domain-containing protein [Kitasatospora sp. SUK 42]